MAQTNARAPRTNNRKGTNGRHVQVVFNKRLGRNVQIQHKPTINPYYLMMHLQNRQRAIDEAKAREAKEQDSKDGENGETKIDQTQNN